MNEELDFDKKPIEQVRHDMFLELDPTIKIDKAKLEMQYLAAIQLYLA